MKWGYIAFTSNFAEERGNQNNFKGEKEKAEDCYMIDNIKEYIKLADSNNLEDNNRTKM